jgi:hypothetical protein
MNTQNETQKEPEIQGKPITYIYKNSLGYFAITGKDWTERTWMLDGNRYEELRKVLPKMKGGLA